MIAPDNETFNDSDKVTLDCLTLGGPANTFQWSFNRAVIENETSAILTLPNVTAEDGGSYTCNVTNAAGSDTNSTYVFISPMITLHPTSMNTVAGENVTLSCDARGFPEPSICWSKENSLLPSSAVGRNTTTLTVGPVKFGDEGFYYCEATSNNLVVVSDRATLSGTKTDHIFLYKMCIVFLLAVAPEAVIFPPSTVGFVGGYIQFTCDVSGGPNNTFQWGPELPNETMSTLMLVNLTVYDADTYYCTVTNAAGNTTAYTELYIAPNIITPPQDMFAIVPANVTFTCVAEGVPLPFIIWEYFGPNNSDPIILDSSASGDLDSGGSGSGDVLEYNVTSTLTIDPVTYDSYGEYVCGAFSNSSEFTNVSSGAILHGKYSLSVPLTVCDCVFAAVSPEDTAVISPDGINATMRNEIYVLSCSAEGGPGNEFQWEKLGSSEIISNSSELEINVTDASVGGTYQCTVENMAGSSSAYATVNGEFRANRKWPLTVFCVFSYRRVH